MARITVTCLGGFGRFGNQLFQYAFARAYAELIGAELHTPSWIGRELFEGINEPVCQESPYPRTESPSGPECDLFGYFQRPEHLAILSRSKLKEWFKPKPEYVKDRNALSFHKRRGDYVNAGCYALVSDYSYEHAARDNGFDPKQAVVYSDSRPSTSQYDDFFSLMHSQVIFRGNSSYSWWAATLSDARVFAPVVGNNTGWLDCEFVEGNHPKMYYLFDDLHIKE